MGLSTQKTEELCRCQPLVERTKSCAKFLVDKCWKALIHNVSWQETIWWLEQDLLCRPFREKWLFPFHSNLLLFGQSHQQWKWSKRVPSGVLVLLLPPAQLDLLPSLSIVALPLTSVPIINILPPSAVPASRPGQVFFGPFLCITIPIFKPNSYYDPYQDKPSKFGYIRAKLNDDGGNRTTVFTSPEWQSLDMDGQKNGSMLSTVNNGQNILWVQISFSPRTTNAFLSYKLRGNNPKS